MVGWESIRDLENVQLAYSTNLDPQSQSDFTPIGQNVSRSWVGTQCVNGPNFADLGLSTGDQVVLQLTWAAGVSDFYTSNTPLLSAHADNNQPRKAAGHECMDLTLLSTSDFAALNMTMPCENHVLSTQMRSSANPRLTQLQAEADAAEASANATSSSGSSSNLTVTQAGIVGAFTTLGVCIIAILAAQVAGIAAFGKKAKIAKRSHDRNVSASSRGWSLR